MKRHRVVRRIVTVGLTWLAALLGVNVVFSPIATSAGHAADASPWDGGSRSAARLIAGNVSVSDGQRIWRAGIDIKLAPGWKTYWRYPGDSGVPPRFNFSRSENVADVEVAWPAPHSFADEGGHSIGYQNEFILPLRVTAKQPDRPIVLRLDLDYAICEKLCVPVEANAELTLTGEPSSLEPALAMNEALVPKAANLGADLPLSIRAVTRTPQKPVDRIIVEVRAPPNTHVDLFAEGPSPDWALPLPEPVAGGPQGSELFAFALDGLPPGANPHGIDLKLTAIADTKAIEVTARLD